MSAGLVMAQQTCRRSFVAWVAGISVLTGVAGWSIIYLATGQTAAADSAGMRQLYLGSLLESGTYTIRLREALAIEAASQAQPPSE